MAANLRMWASTISPRESTVFASPNLVSFIILNTNKQYELAIYERKKSK